METMMTLKMQAEPLKVILLNAIHDRRWATQPCLRHLLAVFHHRRTSGCLRLIRRHRSHASTDATVITYSTAAAAGDPNRRLPDAQGPSPFGQSATQEASATAGTAIAKDQS